MHTDQERRELSELAKATAIELRKRGICAIDNHGEVHFPRPERASCGMPKLCYGCAMLFRGIFKGLDPVTCANLIVAEEVARLSEVFKL